MHTHSGRIVRDRIRIDASPQQVWEAWTDPAKISQWFPDHASGEPRVGSTVSWTWDACQSHFPDLVLEAEPRHRFLLGQAAPAAGRPPALLEILIERQGGGTVLTLVHSGFRDGAEWDDEYQGFASGWTVMLHVLKDYVERHFDRPRAHFFLMKPAAIEYADLGPYFRTAPALARWLTDSGSIGIAGDAVRLALKDGTAVTGQVLAVTPRSILVRWDEIGGVFGVEAFALGPGQRLVSAHLSAWDLDPARAAEIERSIDQALDRLAALFPIPEHARA